MNDYMEMLERRVAHPRSMVQPTDESAYNMQLAAFVERYGPFKSVRQMPGHLNEWAVEATREDGSVVRGALLRPVTARRIE